MNDPYHLKHHGISDSFVLKAFQNVDRIDFVPDKMKSRVYADSPLPIGFKQTISQPSLVAHMTQVLDILPNHSILEIGTGSGFQTVILAEIGRIVTSIEIIPALYETAKRRFTTMKYDNISIILGDGHDGYPDCAPYDRIIVTAASPESPLTLIEQLSSGGKLLIPIGKNHGVQYLTLFEKAMDGTISEDVGIGVRFVPFVRKSS